MRREVVGRVGRALEEVEGEVEGRWGVWVRREMRAERGREEVKGKAEETTVADAEAVRAETTDAKEGSNSGPSSPRERRHEEGDGDGV